MGENADFELDELAAIYVKRGLDQALAREVAQQLIAKDALMAHARARNPKEAADTIGTSALAGEMTTISNGMAAPTENITADVNAACTGRALVISEIPSSSHILAGGHRHGASYQLF